jgi:enhancer of mRNA-decapping protein 3
MMLIAVVTLLWNRLRLAAYTIDSANILDLEVSPQTQEEYTHEYGPVSAIQSKGASIAQPTPQQPFQDPAILSFSKPPTILPIRVTVPAEIVSPVMIADGAIVSPPSATRPHAGAAQSSVSSIGTVIPTLPSLRKSSSATATLTEPFDVTGVNNSETQAIQVKANKKSKRNGNATKEAPSVPVPGLLNVKDLNIPPEATSKKTGRGRGWRQTPLVEEVPIKSNGKKSKHKSRKSLIEDLGGWATEDATDIQEQGDFDFEESLLQFDKKAVFDGLRREDKIASSDRLVGHNRIARPGTYGGKNFHPTENVLSGETEEEEVREMEYSSGKASRRATSKRPPPSRKGSAFPNVEHLRTESPRPLTRTATLASPINGSVAGGTRASFKLAESKRPCQSISPLQMLELEQLCTSELGLTEDMLSENAGRSIAQAILKVNDLGKSVLFLVGNHKSGARAIAAARHLRNRRMRVTVCVLGGEREDMLLEAVRKQLTIYKKGGGFIDKWDQLQSKITGGGQPAPGLVVDALFGIHIKFDELRTDEQAVAFEMIRWATRSANIPDGPHITSIDIPSGMASTEGEFAAEVDGTYLVMTSHMIISLGAPKIALLDVLTAHPDPALVKVFVVDIGISAAAWQKHGSRRRHGVEFGNDWVVEVTYAVAAGTT